MKYDRNQKTLTSNRPGNGKKALRKTPRTEHHRRTSDSSNKPPSLWGSNSDAPWAERKWTANNSPNSHDAMRNTSTTITATCGNKGRKRSKAKTKVGSSHKASKVKEDKMTKSKIDIILTWITNHLHFSFLFSFWFYGAHKILIIFVRPIKFRHNLQWLRCILFPSITLLTLLSVPPPRTFSAKRFLGRGTTQERPHHVQNHRSGLKPRHRTTNTAKVFYFSRFGALKPVEDHQQSRKAVLWNRHEVLRARRKINWTD